MSLRHYRIPARMKLCTNCRWNNRNPTSNGAEVMSVAAQMIDQSMPWSPEENTCRPTVRGRNSTEFVTIRAAAPDMPRGEANRYPRASEGRRAAGQARTERLIPCKSAVSRRASLPSRRWMAGGDSKWLRCRVWPRVSRGLSTKGSGRLLPPNLGAPIRGCHSH